LVLTHSGDDFAVSGMHFKIGLYEHQSAGALEGLVNLLVQNPGLVKGGFDSIERIHIIAYEPAYGIIGDPAKKTPGTRQSADHSMAFIVSRMLLKALQKGSVPSTNQETWKLLMLTPHDYGKDSLFDEKTRALMQKITFEHGGPEYDSKYPDGIPTSIDIFQKGGVKLSSGLVMYPSGHARNTTADLRDLLTQKNKMLGDLVFKEQAAFEKFIKPLIRIKELSAADMQTIYEYDFAGVVDHPCIDGEVTLKRKRSNL
jgi:2-methylcitrate dehydratase